jgi:hypothetical protein
VPLIKNSGQENLQYEQGMKSLPKSYTINGDLSHTMYCELLTYATEVCSQALLVVRRTLPLHGGGAKVLADLQPFLLKKRESREWPGTILSNSTASVFCYNFDSNCASILQNAAESLFSWLQPDLPEDLCLLKANEEPWLVSISHEKDSFLNLTYEEKERLLKALPSFRSILAVISQ